MPAFRLFCMFEAALNTEIGTESCIDWRDNSWMPSQFRCAWLFIMPGIRVLPLASIVSTPDSFGASAFAPTAAILPSFT